MRRLDETTFVSDRQITVSDVNEAAASGIRLIVNNRPDGEEPGQPLAAEIEDAAARAGIAYHFVPIIRGIGPADVEEMQKAWREAEGGKLLAFCRSGRRSAFACALAHRDEGTSRETVEQRLMQAGFDYGPIAHLL